MIGTILVVEDDPGQRHLLRAILGTQYALLEAADIETAWALLQEHCPDLVLLDGRLGSERGIDLARRIRATVACRDTPIVAVSGYTGDGYQQALHEAGVTCYVTKPYRPTQLRAIIAAGLRPDGLTEKNDTTIP